MGPAGSGKSTYCATIMNHYTNIKRSVHLVNLDPAAEKFEYTPSIDIRDLITLEDVMDELDYGPNGGLMYCFEYLLENIDWLSEQLGDYSDDYLIIDCPGQIELYTHSRVMKQICYILTSSYDYRIVGVYCLESQFMEDIGKYFAGVTSSMATMCNIEIPFINVMTKMDLVENKGEVEKYMDPDSQLLMEESSKVMSSKFMELNKALVRVIDDNSIVSFIPLNIRDEDSIGYVVSHADNAIQYGEDEEPKEPQELEEPEEYEEYEEYEQD